jgi:ankyrin repeat protein
LTELLGESGDINQTDSYGRTVLHTLAADGNASLLELALAACPQVHIIFNNHSTISTFDKIFFEDLIRQKRKFFRKSFVK